MAYTFHFVGGCNDGKVVRTDSSVERERTRAEGYLAMTQDGTVGARVVCMFDAAIASLFTRSTSGSLPQVHLYEVVERTMDSQGCVCVRMRYVGVAS